MLRHALIDGDEAAFKVCATGTRTIDWGDGEETLPPPPALAAARAIDLVRSWADEVKADKITVCFSCRDRKLFRRDLDPTYKQSRTEKPEAFWAAVEALSHEFNVAEYPRLEADDVMGFMSAATKDEQPIIVSSDKDMKTVPCWLFDPYHKTKKKITREQADLWWMTQTLTGDTADGYKGCPKVGPVKARAALGTCAALPQMWSAVVNEFAVKDLAAAHAILQARLARILRPTDVDLKKRSIRLWHPKEDVWVSM